MNIMRQSLATAICFYAYSISRIKGISLKFIIIAILAINSHNTAIFAIGMIVLFHYMSKLAEKTFDKLFIYFIIAITSVLYSMAEILILLTLFFKKDYTIYFDASVRNEVWAETHVSTVYVILIGLFIIASYWSYKKGIMNAYDVHELKCNTIVFISCIILGAMFTGSMLRLISYFSIITICEICFIVSQSNFFIRPKVFVKTMVIILFIVVFIKTFYPGLEYSSSILSL